MMKDKCVRLGKLQKSTNLLDGIAIANDSVTKSVISSLKGKGILKTNKFNQFKLKKDVKTC